MNHRVAVLVLVMGAWAGTSQSQECTDDQARRAESIASTLTTWPAIYEAFQSYGHCSDGSIAEGFKVAVTETLANRWQGLVTLQAIVEKDARFRAFVLDFISDGTESLTFQKVASNAAHRCPPKGAELCAGILKRVAEVEQSIQR